MKNNLMIVGPTRTGSTALFRALIKSPDVCGSKVKELNYFYNNNFDPTDYLSHFNNSSGQYTLEASPNYFLYSKYVAQKVYSVNPDFKIVIVLRDPVERLESIANFILMKRAPGKFSSLSDVLNSQVLHYPNECDDMDKFVAMESNYEIHVSEWINMFGNGNVRVFFFDEMKNPEFLPRLCGFLGIDDDGLRLTRENKTRIVKNMPIHKLAKSTNDYLEPVFNKFPVLRDIARGLYYGVNEKPRGNQFVMSDNEIEHWKSYYSSPNRKLKELIVREGLCDSPLPEWLMR